MGGTLNQIWRKGSFKDKKVIKTPALKSTIRVLDKKPENIRFRVIKRKKLLNPQKSAKCLRNVSVMSPKKPNSAKRQVMKVEVSNKVILYSYIPGMSQHRDASHQSQKASKVLIRGGRVQDLPGVHYKIIRGKLDCAPILIRRNARSKYGARRWWSDSSEEERRASIARRKKRRVRRSNK